MTGGYVVMAHGAAWALVKPDGAILYYDSLETAHLACVAMIVASMKRGAGTMGKQTECEHKTTHTYVASAINGPVKILQCLKCNLILTRTGATTSAQTAHMRELAARDGKEAGKPKRCTHGGLYLGFGDYSEFCAKCALHALDRTLAEVNTERLVEP